jgi:hypothetical protein
MLLINDQNLIFMAPNILKDTLLDLIKNALENTPDGSEIRIGVEG